MVRSALTPQEIAEVTKLLGKLEAGELPLDIFLQFARLMVVPVIELVVLRRNGAQIEVLLTKRPDDDPIWPGLLHSPGTVIRATDRMANSQDAFQRIIAGELFNILLAGEPHFLQILFHQEKRGAALAQVYWVEATGEPPTGNFYDVTELPENLVDTQREFIQAAAQAFRLVS